MMKMNLIPQIYKEKTRSGRHGINCFSVSGAIEQAELPETLQVKAPIHIILWENAYKYENT